MAGAAGYHPACHHRADETAEAEAWPALIAAVTDLSGAITGVQRTWLARDGSGKAPLATPRRAMGSRLGHGVRFGTPDAVLAAGEGIETMLTLRAALRVCPGSPLSRPTTSAALLLPEGLRHLYIAQDADPAGLRAAERLAGRAAAEGIAARPLVPVRGDFNDDLRAFGVEALQARLLAQIAPHDTEAFLSR